MLQTDTELHEEIAMSLGEHLEELRKRLGYAVIGAGVCITASLFYATRLIVYLEKPYTHIMKKAGLEPQLQSLSPTDGFVSYLKIATWAGLLVASPWIFYQLWKFVSAGLHPHERKYVHYAAPASAILFITGVLFCFYFIAPITIEFLIQFNKDMLGISSFFRFEDYMSFMVGMIVAFGLSFETPVVMFFLNKFGLLKMAMLKKSRRFVVLFCVVVAAIITPGQDMISLFALTGALYVLFEIGVLAIFIAGKRN